MKDIYIKSIRTSSAKVSQHKKVIQISDSGKKSYDNPILQYVSADIKLEIQIFDSKILEKITYIDSNNDFALDGKRLQIEIAKYFINQLAGE